MPIPYPESEQLRNHIQNLLYKYAITHLTIDHKKFTEAMVAELLLQCLTEIPILDPKSLVILAEPFDVLTKFYSLNNLPAFEEKFQTNTDSLSLIKVSCNISGKPKSERVLENFSCDSSLEAYISFVIPAAPVLSLCANRETPKPGLHNERIQSLPPTYQELKSNGYETLQVDDVKEETLSSDHILKTNWTLSADEHAAVSSLIKNTSDMFKPRSDYKHSYLDFSCRQNTPPPFCYPEPPFIPIFPRRKSTSHTDLSDLNLNALLTKAPSTRISKVKVEEENSELLEENMLVVDGWQTLQVSSPSPLPTPNSSQGDAQIDQLFSVSSPNTDLDIFQELEAKKIEMTIMPRIERIGGDAGRGDHIVARKNLNNFLLPLLPKLEETNDPLSFLVAQDDELGSMLGQPPSAQASTYEQVSGFDEEIRNLFAPQDPLRFILDEKLDASYEPLMEVPDLCLPNGHAQDEAFLPRRFKDMVLPPKGSKGEFELDLRRYLKKAKGVASLRLSLSWIPFTTRTKLPNHAEMAGVSESDGLVALLNTDNTMLEPTSTQNQVQNLLDSVGVNRPDNDFEENIQLITGYSLNDALNDDASTTCFPDFEILLTRQERQRISKTRRRQDNVGTDHDAGALACDQRPTKRSRMDSASPEIQSSYIHSFEDLDGLYTPWEVPVYEDDEPIGGCSFPISPEALEPTTQGLEEYFNAESYDEYLSSHEELTHNYQIYVDNLGQFDSLFLWEPEVTLTSGQEDFPAEEIHHQGEVGPNGKNEDAMNCNSPLNLSLNKCTPQLEIHTLGSIAFAHLRAKKVSEEVVQTTENAQVSPTIENETEPEHDPPEGVYDRNTLRLQNHNEGRLRRTHKYMGSLDVLQKQALVRCFRMPDIAIELIERDNLGGVDLILDPHSAIILAPLLALPSQCEGLIKNVANASWTYYRLLLIFEAYPATFSFNSSTGLHKNRQPSIYAYTPPIMKAIKKFRRDLDIAEAFGEKRSQSVVQFAFVDNVKETAMYARLFGDMLEDMAVAEERNALWGEREWLDMESSEEEGNLALLDGLNRFSASIILSQMSVEELLELPPDARIDGFGSYIGFEAMQRANADIEARLQVIASSDDDPEIHEEMPEFCN